MNPQNISKAKHKRLLYTQLAKSIIIIHQSKAKKKIFNFLDRMVTPIAESWYNYVNYYSKNTGIRPGNLVLPLDSVCFTYKKTYCRAHKTQKRNTSLLRTF